MIGRKKSVGSLLIENLGLQPHPLQSTYFVSAMVHLPKTGKVMPWQAFILHGFAPIDEPFILVFDSVYEYLYTVIKGPLHECHSSGQFHMIQDRTTPL